MKKFCSLAFAVGFAAALFSAPQAQAGTCPVHAGNSVTSVSGCELGDTNNDSLNPLQVNIDSMFGFTDWTFDAKDDGLDGVNQGTNSLNLVLTGGQTAGGSDDENTTILGGSWTIANNAFNLYEDIMLVFKGGTANPSEYVGYLLSATSGMYQSPFINPNNDNLKEISHVSLYVRGTASTIPLPAGILLLLTGIGGLAFVGRRRKALA